MHKRKFLKSSVIGFGFLSGLWAGLGVDPSTFVAHWLEQILLTIDPSRSTAIALIFLYGPTLLTILSIIFVYRRGGMLGFVAVALAYAAGFLLAFLNITTGLLLLVLAFIIGWFAARRT